ncbi:MAG: DUF5606 domain-containing protein [Marinilabiliaceae bacterium]|jgi:hypothetical protein|nr:DUF5606 domain-containing protein [Marinilabiliaceae bacterium]
MKLKDILSISGEGGLFRFIAQGKNSIIVEHLETKKRSAAHGTAKVSSLVDIAIFTEGEEVPLGDVFDRIFEKEEGGEAINHKSTPDELKAYFGEVLPDYDRDRVYVSDIRKLISWYNTLQSLKLLVPGSDNEDEAESTGEAGNSDQADTDRQKPENEPKAEE